ncbi:MAG: glycine oxidase ThiO [Lentisphaeria bacterium]|nr:glycine oxidase ThiO [Lentisphaeria bacterium]
MLKSVAVVGAGIVGRLTSYLLAKKGYSVTLFDRNEPSGNGSCSYVGAGMLAPYCELETAELEVTAAGIEGIHRWQEIISTLPKPVFFQQTGSLVVAHPNDMRELDRLEREVQAAQPPSDAMQRVSTKEIIALEPEMTQGFHTGLYFPNEAQISNRDILVALDAGIQQMGVVTRYGCEIETLEAGRLNNGTLWQGDYVIDCRGMGAKQDLTDFRGVRGELIRLHAPEVQLNRPVRIMHPRYPIYIVPRPNHHYILGATMIESDDMSPISLRSSMELLSAAYAVHTGFAEARVLENLVHCRPAFQDNLPKLICEDGILRINGLHRHGFLLTPSVVDAAIHQLEGTSCSEAQKTLLGMTP